MWKPRKTVKKNIERMGCISKETYLLLLELQGDKPTTSKVFEYTANSMKVVLCRLFKRLKFPYSSHDFRHTKLTELSQTGMTVGEI